MARKDDDDDDRVLVDRLWRTREDSVSEHATLARRPRPKKQKLYPKCSIIDVFSRCPVQRETFLPSPVSSVRCPAASNLAARTDPEKDSRVDSDFAPLRVRAGDCANCMRRPGRSKGKGEKMSEKNSNILKSCRLGCSRSSSSLRRRDSTKRMLSSHECGKEKGIGWRRFARLAARARHIGNWNSRKFTFQKYPSADRCIARKRRKI